MKFLAIPLLAGIFSSFISSSDFLALQKKYPRVRAAIEEKKDAIASILQTCNMDISDINILFIAYKLEGKLDIYAKEKKQTHYTKLITYNICASSGVLGPKRKQGDRQVPEGFYHIDRFNPTSNFHLSLGINYPNTSDKKKSNTSNLGGDIFIHGSCETIGCLPMTDNKIKEIYLLALYAKNCGQDKIPVYIFPFKMNEESITKHTKRHKNKDELLSFWNNLKEGFDEFEKEQRELKLSFDHKGNYIFN